MQPRGDGRRSVALTAGVAIVAIFVVAFVAQRVFDDPPAPTGNPTRSSIGPPPTFEHQACSLPSAWWTRVQRGYFGPRSGDISILPRYPAYMARPTGGGTHSGPWPHLQRVPIVFYGPGALLPAGEVDRPVTTAEVAPTLARLLGASFESRDGKPMREVGLATRSIPRLIVVIVWDGGGWNTLRQWPDAWPNLAGMIDKGTLFTNATVGSSPSVTPSIHTTLGTGAFPDSHGITGIWVRDEDGLRVDSFLRGQSSRFIETPTLAERWDEENGNRPLIGMVAYDPWHLGMIGQGSERTGGDKDEAAWLNIETNEWTSNSNHYSMPSELAVTPGLDNDLRRTDAADGKIDGAWRDNSILDQVDRVEETPGFITYHTRAMINMMSQEGYGADSVTDLLFTNYKQIDRNGHYYGMSSDEVRDAVVESDRQLGVLFDALDDIVGRSDWAVVLTADHGQQPNDSDIGAYGIDPNEVKDDINDEFGPVAEGVFPTEIYLDTPESDARGVTIEEVAAWLSDYRLAENARDTGGQLLGAGELDPQDRIFDLTVPSTMVPEIECR